MSEMTPPFGGFESIQSPRSTPPFGSRIETLVAWNAVSLLIEARPVRAGTVGTAPASPSNPAAPSKVGCPASDESEQPAVNPANAVASTVTQPSRYNRFRIMDCRQAEVERRRGRPPPPRHKRARETACVPEAASQIGRAHV